MLSIVPLVVSMGQNRCTIVINSLLGVSHDSINALNSHLLSNLCWFGSVGLVSGASLHNTITNNAKESSAYITYT